MNFGSRPPHAIALPAGRLITSEEGHGDQRPLWLSDRPASAAVWSHLRAEHDASGLWPLLLDALDPQDSDFRPQGCGELSPERMSSPADHNPEELLVRWWQRYTAIDQDDGLATDRRHAITAPFGQTCPELTPALAASADPDAVAEQHLRDFLLHNAHLHLGLVAASGGADALAAVGWNGPLNYDGDTATFAAVVRDWENRFGARVVSVGLATPHLSVAAPPARHEDALLVAAEHFAFCPDTIWQGSYSTLAAYAESLFDAKCWEFWWDCPGRPICERRSFSRWTPRRPVVCVMAGERAGHDAPPPPPAGGNRRE